MDENKQKPDQAQSIPVPTPPITDVSRYIRKKYFKSLVLAITSTAILVVCIVIFLPQAIQLAFFPIALLLLCYSYIKHEAENAFFKQFAALNGLSFSDEGLPDNLNGSLFSIGHSTHGYDLISGSYQSTPFELFNYQYTVGSGKNSQTFEYTVFRLDYSSPLPPIFLRSKVFSAGGSFF